MSNGWLIVLLVSLGGFCGVIARFKVSAIVTKRFPSMMPYGTLTVNILGSFALGWMWGSTPSDYIKLGFGTGFLGAFTTFSTIQLDSMKLLKGKYKNYFVLYTLLTYLIGIGLAFIGFFAAKSIY
ncbi:fluoride efflux transporter FluC [Paenibacillus sp. KN14-4R]|uniref:fluoride efflux transporter FluC n=1 Tax=Paenibacillus sp. KN14-4R TaxID=3445773 RepID=UPI003F9ED47E